MKKYKIPIDECECGSILAADVFNEKGSLIIAEGAVLDEDLKKSLKALGINDLWIFPQEDDYKLPDAADMEEFKERYTEQAEQLRYIVKDLVTGENFELDDLTEIVNKVCYEIDNNLNLVSFMREMKKFDDDTFTHCLNVAFYSALICKWTNKNPRKTKNIIMTALLHDIGKLMVPPEILNKREKLLPEEVEILKMHVIHGYNLVKDNLSIDSDIKLGIMMHHERENGTGYPMNLRNHQLNLNTKVISIADVYDALISDRPYRKAYTPFQAFHIMKNESFSSFDVDILNTFINSVSHYYLGTKVILNTNAIGKIVHIPPHSIEKPIVCVDTEYIDLSRESELEIVSLV